MAQWLSWLERRPVTAEVIGSSPTRVAGTVSIGSCSIGSVAQLVERTTENREVNGSTPFGATEILVILCITRFFSI